MKRYSKILVGALFLAMLLCSCGHTHEFGEWSVVKEPSCSEEGATERSCSCGEKETAPIPMIEHVFSEELVAKEATCAEDGLMVQTCANCNDAVTTAIPRGEHVYTEAITKNATCVEEGEKTQTCTICGHVVTAAIPVGDHAWKSASCTSPSTCSVCGASSGAAGGHQYQAATCTAPETCAVCGATQGAALGCEAGADGSCVRCGKSLIPLSSVLSQPIDTIEELKTFVSSYYVGDCYKAGNFRLIFNSADGVYLSWGATNTSTKEIKYITFTINYYNKVGDPASDEISRKTSYTARMTGPIGAGKSFYIRSLIGYGSDIYYGTITDVKIEYMDGTTVSGNYGYTTWHNIKSSGSPKECVVIEN